MMDFMTGGSLSDALAPKLQVGQEALYDSLRARDGKRAVKIIKRVAKAQRSGRGARGTTTDSNGRKVPEVQQCPMGRYVVLLVYVV